MLFGTINIPLLELCMLYFTFQGPWWDSEEWCRSTNLSGKERAAGGLPRRELEHAARALLIQLPVDIYHGPSNPKFWNDAAAQRARNLIAEIVEVLWPEAYRNKTVFPIPLPDPTQQVGWAFLRF